MCSPSSSADEVALLVMNLATQRSHLRSYINLVDRSDSNRHRRREEDGAALPLCYWPKELSSREWLRYARHPRVIQRDDDSILRRRVRERLVARKEQGVRIRQAHEQHDREKHKIQ